MNTLERFSKAAAIASVVAIVALQLLAEPDLTPLLRVLTVAAFIAGWTAGHSEYMHAAGVTMLVLAPALLRLLAGREGPVLDLVPMALLAGALIRDIRWSRWQLPPLWSVLIGGWALTLSLSWPVIVGREAGFEVSGLFSAGMYTSWAALTSTQTIAWIGSVVMTQLVGLLWLDWVFGKTQSAGRPPLPLQALWIAVSLASVVAILQAVVDRGFLTTAIWEAKGRSTGTMLDANAFGAAAAFAGPAAFIASRAGLLPGGWRAGALLLGLNVIGAWLSESRTMLLIADIGLAGLLVGLWLTRRERPRRGARIAAVAAGAGVLIALLLTVNAGPLRRLFEMPGGRSLADMPGREVVAELLWRRGGYGTVAHQMVREYPAGGVGIGSFHFMVADYWRIISNDDALPFDNAQNWWRHTLAELGLLGGTAPLLWSLLIAWAVVHPHRPSPSDPQHPTQRGSPLADYTLRGLLVGTGLCSLLGVPTQNPAVLLAFFGVLAWLVAPAPMGEPSRKWLTAAWIGVTLLAIAYSTTHLVLARGSLEAGARAARFHREYVGGGYGLEQDEEQTPYHWTDDNSRFVLPRDAPWVVLRLWANHPDLAEHPIHVVLSAQCGPFFETTISGPERQTVGVQVPERYPAVDLNVSVSRTWSPADLGEPDRRRLGVALVYGFADDLVGRAADKIVTLPECPGLAAR